jgi:hypothetical protein
MLKFLRRLSISLTIIVLIPLHVSASDDHVYNFMVSIIASLHDVAEFCQLQESAGLALRVSNPGQATNSLTEALTHIKLANRKLQEASDRLQPFTNNVNYCIKEGCINIMNAISELNSANQMMASTLVKIYNNEYNKKQGDLADVISQQNFAFKCAWDHLFDGYATASASVFDIVKDVFVLSKQQKQALLKSLAPASFPKISLIKGDHFSYVDIIRDFLNALLKSKSPSAFFSRSSPPLKSKGAQ